MKPNCVTESLDRWCDKGGYIAVFRRSSHWGVGHVMHIDSDGRLTSFGPEKDLAHPAAAIFGFDGVIKDYDPSPAEPMTPRGVFVSAGLFAVLATAWCLRRAWKRWRVGE